MDIKNVSVIPTVNEKQELFELSNKIYESTLDEIVRLLNTYHTTSKSKRYWEIIVGVWSRMLIESVATRTLIVQSVLKNDKDTNIVVSPDLPLSYSPQCLQNFQADLKTVSWNASVYNDIFEILNGKRQQNTFVKIPREIIAPPISKKFGPSYLSSTYLPRPKEFQLAIKLGSIPHRAKQIQLPITNSDEKTRELKLDISINGSEIAHVVNSLALQYMPHSYLEEFSVLLDRISREYPKKPPRSIFTANRHLYDDVFNVWVANATSQGSSLTLGQHGGYFGISKYPSFAERHELSIADRYITWGRKTSSRTVPGPILTTIGMNRKSIATGSKLVVVTEQLWSLPRSSFSDFDDSPTYVEHLESCNKSLPGNIRNSAKIRLHPSDGITAKPMYDWWMQHIPGIEIDDCSDSFRKTLKSAKLIVVAHNSTTLPETFSMNIPTLVSWKPEWVEIRDSAKPIFNKLEEVGIFHSDSDGLARHITAIWDDVGTWWQSSDVRDARKLFCDSYARSMSQPLKFLRSLLKESNS